MHVESEGTCCGFEFKVILQDLGFRCGYVRLPKGHPWYGMRMFDIPAKVHGGITFADFCSCGPLDGGFWIGFDCAHVFDSSTLDDVSEELRGTNLANLMVNGIFDSEPANSLRSLFNHLFGISEEDSLECERQMKAMRKPRSMLYVESQCKNLAAECFDVAKRFNEKKL